MRRRLDIMQRERATGFAASRDSGYLVVAAEGNVLDHTDTLAEALEALTNRGGSYAKRFLMRARDYAHADSAHELIADVFRHTLETRLEARWRIACHVATATVLHEVCTAQDELSLASGNVAACVREGAR